MLIVSLLGITREELAAQTLSAYVTHNMLKTVY